MSPVLYNWLYVVSALLLVAGLIAVEVYRHRRGTAGTVVNIIATGSGFGLGDGRMTVRLDDGTEVEAAVPGCVQCMGQMRAGDRVLVTKLGDKYMVGLATGLGRKKICAHGAAGRPLPAGDSHR